MIIKAFVDKIQSDWLWQDTLIDAVLFASNETSFTTTKIYQIIIYQMNTEPERFGVRDVTWWLYLRNILWTMHSKLFTHIFYMEKTTESFLRWGRGCQEWHSQTEYSNTPLTDPDVVKKHHIRWKLGTNFLDCWNLTLNRYVWLINTSTDLITYDYILKAWVKYSKMKWPT